MKALHSKFNINKRTEALKESVKVDPTHLA